LTPDPGSLSGASHALPPSFIAKEKQTGQSQLAMPFCPAMTWGGHRGLAGERGIEVTLDRHNGADNLRIYEASSRRDARVSFLAIGGQPPALVLSMIALVGSWQNLPKILQ
jgi:hypothetical protein